MAWTPGQGAGIQQEVYGSWVTEMSPASLPAGCSPDNQDVVYGPGTLASRPCASRVFANPFPAATVYEKTYIDQTGARRNFVLTADGSLWLSVAGGTPSIIYTTLAGNKAKSVTAFGKEYIAISDGLHGADVPLQYDSQYGLFRLTQDGPGAAPTVTSIPIAPSTLSGLNRTANIVTGTTATAHQLLEGYQAQISGTTPSVVGTAISSIVIDNESQPGLALITTSTAHGLAPQSIVNLVGVTNTTVGGATSVVVFGGIATATTTTPHELSVGAQILVQTSGGPVLSFTVYQIISPTSFTYLDAGADGTYTGGTVQLVWPLSNAPAGFNNFTVQTCPSDTTFYVSISYSDGTWTGGTVTLAWDGTFYVISVPSPTTFTYQQYGPDATYTTPGIVTPFGQASPGLHQVRCSFTTIEGYVTKPGPQATVNFPGGQYVQVSDIPIGPANVTTVNIEFSGASGNFFFYIPVPAQENGQVVSTATSVPNGTTSVVLDFSDSTLFAAIGTTTPGNQTLGQIVLDGALGFGLYDTRLVTGGQRNTVQEFLNMGFAGGSLFSSITDPTGWTVTGSGGALNTTGNGIASFPSWLVTATGAGTLGTISQGAYLDSYGAPILQPNTQYTLRARLLGSGGNWVANISSASTGFSSTVSLTPMTGISVTHPVQGDFSLKTPSVIPEDMKISFSFVATAAGTLIVQEMQFVYTANPFLDNNLFESYGNNPEGINGLSGKIGPSDDTRKIMDWAAIRGTLFMLTQEPSGRLHQTQTNGVTEPAGWEVGEVAANCGTLSAFCLAKSQADSSTSSGGEEWFIWGSESGARIFGGGDVYKISQEIQPNWHDPQSTNLQINMGAALSTWCINDPVTRQVYFGLPLGTNTAPNLMYVLNYRELDSAFAIAGSPPYHPSFSGKLIATDNTRKWTRWNLPAVYGARMAFNSSELEFTICAGDNLYTFDPTKLFDDDFGTPNGYYITNFGPTADQALANQLPLGIKQLNYSAALISGVGQVTVQPYPNDLNFPWPIPVTRPLTSPAKNYLEFNGFGVKGFIVAYKISITELTPGAGYRFALNDLIFWYSKARTSIRGAS